MEVEWEATEYVAGRRIVHGLFPNREGAMDALSRVASARREAGFDVVRHPGGMMEVRRHGLPVIESQLYPSPVEVSLS